MNMAGDMAMTKLMPKPDISITISMAGGGGLSSMAPRMNIGGQPYKLSYIDPKQAAIGKPIVYRQTSGAIDDDFDQEDIDYGSAFLGISQDLVDAGADPGEDGTGPTFIGADPYEGLRDATGNVSLARDGVVDMTEWAKATPLEDTPLPFTVEEEGDEEDTAIDDRNILALAPYMVNTVVDKDGLQQHTIKEQFLENPMFAKKVQDAIDRGNLQGAGIAFANAWENQNLNTFGKGLRSSLEAWSAGKALSRNKYDPIVLAGLTGSPTERFDVYLQNAEKGQTLREVINEYVKDTGASQTEKNNILSSYGFSDNENVQATEVAGAMNEARQKGAIQGAGMMFGFGPTTLLDLTTKAYTGPPNLSGRRDQQSFAGQVGEAVGKEVGKLIPEVLRTIVDKGTSGLKTIGQIGQLVTDPKGALGDLITKSGDNLELKTVGAKTSQYSKPNYALIKKALEKQDSKEEGPSNKIKRVMSLSPKKEKVLTPIKVERPTIKKPSPQKVSQLDNDPLVDTGDNITLANLARTLKRKPEDIVTETVTEEEEEVVDKSPDKFGERRLASLGGLQNIFRQAMGRQFRQV